MKPIFVLLLLITSAVSADIHSETAQHAHDGHSHEHAVDGKRLEVDADRFDTFVRRLSDVQIAVVSVHGMVCDFCARGIEKMFKRDKHVKKIDVDLSKGKVLIAYTRAKKIDLADITKKILANGQTVTELQVLHIE